MTQVTSRSQMCIGAKPLYVPN